MGSIRVGHYQCVCHPGDFTANLETVLDGLQQGRERGIELMSFPESLLGGYWSDEGKCRENAWPLESTRTHELLEATASSPLMFMVGFNELRGDDLYNTVVLCEGGQLVGQYSKAFPVMRYFKPGRECPVFEKNGVKFGIIICADGGFPEPTRVMVMKGARIIFAPHYNYIGRNSLIDHYVHVRNDHVARAVENGVFFVRGNNVEVGDQPSLGGPGVGYGDSYILDPNGQIVAAANLHGQTLVYADVDLDRRYYGWHNKSATSARVFWEQLRDAAAEPGQ